jgi:hypothetical protein
MWETRATPPTRRVATVATVATAAVAPTAAAVAAAAASAAAAAAVEAAVEERGAWTEHSAAVSGARHCSAPRRLRRSYAQR